jgi:hypothetical protein
MVCAFPLEICWQGKGEAYDDSIEEIFLPRYSNIFYQGDENLNICLVTAAVIFDKTPSLLCRVS